MSQTIVLGGGCFWCLDAAFRMLAGVETVVSGYAGGDVEDPSYEQVTTGTTGHAEVVRVTFDPKVLPEEALLDIFFALHDPTTVDRQGNDVGPQYRSIIFYDSPEQKQAVEAAINRAKPNWNDPIVTQVEPLTKFYPAEEYHQDYFTKHPDQPYCQLIINPKVAKIRQDYADRLKP